MKKTLLALSILATVAMFSSCNKHCTCKTYLNGTVISTTEDIEVESGKKCSDMNALITTDPKTGVECSSQLF